MPRGTGQGPCGRKGAQASHTPPALPPPQSPGRGLSSGAAESEKARTDQNSPEAQEPYSSGEKRDPKRGRGLLEATHLGSTMVGLDTSIPEAGSWFKGP